MHKLKKMLAILLAVPAIGCSVSMTVNAEELIPMEEGITSLNDYDPCDIDQDGDVDIADVLTLNQYLAGLLYVPDYDRMDANRNYIVDYTDADYVLNKLINIDLNPCFILRSHDDVTNNITESEIHFPFNITGNAIYDSSASSTDTRWYARATYSNNHIDTLLSNYGLTPSSTPLTSGNTSNIESVIGNDDRYWAYNSNYVFGEVSGIVNVNGGTGFIVGDHEIATCGHIVLDSHNFKEDITVKTCDAQGNISNSTLSVAEVHVPLGYLNSDVPELDYALITVEDDLSNYFHFTLGNSYSVTISNFSNIPIYVTGRPDNGHFRTASGRIISNSNTTMLHYNTDTQSGNSGSPVYTITKNTKNGVSSYTYTVLAVHRGGTNQGSLITKYHQKFYLNNPQAHHGENLS